MLRRVLAVTAVALMGIVGSAQATTINVNTTDEGFVNNDDCGLREAVEAARTNKNKFGCPKGSSSRDTIKLKGQLYALSFISTNEDLNANGDIDVTGGGPITIVGKGSDDTVVSQNSADRVFDVTALGDLTLSKLQVAGGDVTGFSAAVARGGDLRVAGGKLKVTKSEVSSGDALVGGLIHAQDTSKLTVSNSFLETGDATAAGGAISLQSSAKGTIKKTTLQQMDVASSTQSARGGVIVNEGGGLKVLSSILQGSSVETTGAGNSASGGAVYSVAPLTVRQSLIRGNTATAAQDNVTEHGGGLYLGNDATVVNTTFFDDRAGTGGDNDGIGGAIYVSSGTVEVSHVTIDSGLGTASGDAIGTTGGSVSLFGSLIDDSDDVCSGAAVTSAGYNVTEEEDAQCAFNGTDADGVVTGLGSLADNGGFSETIAFAPTSTAKDRVPKNLCKQATKNRDQRGFKRPKGEGCDSGAFELGAKKP